MTGTAELNLRPLSPGLLKRAVDELNEVPERIAEDITVLQTWIAKQAHLRARTSPQFLLAFLRGCKFSLEKAKQKLESFYTIRTNCPDLFQSLADEQHVRALIRLSINIYLPLSLGEDGPRLNLMRIGAVPTDKYNVFDFIRMGSIARDIHLINDDNAVVAGIIQLVDLENANSSHVLQINPTFIKRFTHFTKEALPLRLQAIHLFNVGSGFETIFSTVRPLMPPKTQQRISVHGNVNSLFKAIPRKYLPVEYGGENGTIEEIAIKAEEEFMQFRAYLLKEKDYGTDEKLRIKPASLDPIYGTEGSFRKLNID